MNKSILRSLALLISRTGAAALIIIGSSAQGLGVRTVIQNGDSGPGSLRQAIADSAAGDAITFSVSGEITINSGSLIINKNLLLSGPGARKLKLTGFVGSPILSISSPIVTITDLTIGPGASGISLAGGLTMTRCAVSGNTQNGGLTIGAGSTLTMNDCTISGNQSHLISGGGMLNRGTSTLTNCTIAGNASIATAGQPNSGGAGGLMNIDGTLILKSCTVTANSADVGGGGIGSVSGSTTRLTNTILANNTAGVSGPDCSGAGFVSDGYNLIGIKDGGSGFTNGVNHDIVGTAASPRNALLLPLQDNGGTTDTAAMFASASPAFNAGGGTVSSRDQRGFIRPDTADIGACEFLATQPVVLANISSRAVVQSGDNVIIGGFIITGTQPKKVAIRAIGPSLNLAGKLDDPALDLYNSSSQLLISNDEWGTAPNTQEIINLGLAPSSSKESVILTSLAPGAYTAIVRSSTGLPGIGVVEAYDLDRTVNSRLANISTRAFVQTGDNVLIGGFIVLGPDSLDVVVRGIGPSLSVPNHLLDPKLELHDGNGTTLATNDNWRSTQEPVLIATGVAPTNDAESAILTFLGPGSYTAIVSGVNNATGVAVVEVYGLQ